MDVNDQIAQALALMDQGEHEHGLTLLRRLWRAVPTCDNAGLQLSTRLADLGRLLEAIEVCRHGRAIAVDPWPFVQNYAVFMSKLGRHDEAETAAFDVIETGGERGLNGVLHLARLRMMRDDLEGAIELFQTIAATPELREWALTRLLGMTRNFPLDTARRVAWLNQLIATETGHDDAPEFGPVHEADVTGDPHDPVGVAAILRRYGCVILRGVYDPAALAPVAAQLDKLSQADQCIGFRDFTEVTGGAEAANALVPAPIWNALTEHFGERPKLALNHCWGRHVGANDGEYLHWHQDIARIYLNGVVCWTPMDPCGVDAPGLELAGRRLRQLLDTDIGQNAAEEMPLTPAQLADYAPLDTRMIPSFAPGDCALFFTSQAHRTHVAPGMSKIRRSLEFRFIRQNAS